MFSAKRSAFMLELEGLDGAHLSSDQLNNLHNDWRSVLRLNPDDELQIIFRKRVHFTAWIEKQLSQAMTAKNAYGRRILLNHLSEQIERMSEDQPQLLSQKIIACLWINEKVDSEILKERRDLFRAQVESCGFRARVLNRKQI